MKKILTVILVIVLTLSLFGCNGCADPSAGSADHLTNATEPDAPSAETTEAPTEESTDAPTEETTEEPTEKSTEAPTEETTEVPTEETTETPTEEPSEAPTGHTHSYTSAITAPGCETGGQTTHTCACGDSYTTDQTAATGHKFGEWVTTEESTTLKHGTAERTCAACGKTESKQLDKLPMFHKHSYTAKVVAPTCTTEGYTVHTCACGDTYTDTPTAKTAHTYTKAVTNPTCTAEGYTTYTCSACGHSYMGDKTPKSAHSYTDTVTKPTCTAEGYTTHKCTKCGGTTVDTKVPATGHAYTESTTVPTCETDGYTTYTCATCGHSYQGNRQPATGHTNTLVSDTATCTSAGTKTEKCGTCGKTQTSASQAKGHGETRTETTGASCTGTGVEKTICNVCNTVLSEKTVQGGAAHTWEYKPCSEVVKDEMSRGLMSQPKYANFTDHCVAVCSVCKTSNWDDIVQRYSDYEMAAIMLSYVNALRESVHGTDEYNLVLDSGLINKAKDAAKTISTNGMNHTSSNENITNVGCTIYQHFNGWKNSTAHYNTMVNADENSVGYCGYTRFGYAMYRVGTIVYGVMEFGY